MSAHSQIRWAVRAELSREVKTWAICNQHKLDRHATHARSMHVELARRAGLALGLAYAMRDRGERRRLVVAQLREARALDLLSRQRDFTER